MDFLVTPSLSSPLPFFARFYLLARNRLIIDDTIFPNLCDTLHRRLVVKSMQVARVVRENGIVLVGELLGYLQGHNRLDIMRRGLRRNYGLSRRFGRCASGRGAGRNWNARRCTVGRHGRARTAHDVEKDDGHRPE